MKKTPTRVSFTRYGNLPAKCATVTKYATVTWTSIKLFNSTIFFIVIKYKN